MLRTGVLIAALAGMASPSRGDDPPAPTTTAASPGPTLAALVPPSLGEDARTAIVIGARGEVYEPSGKGVWVRKQRLSTAGAIAVAGRAGTTVIASGDGVVYRLAANGWSAIRLHQKDRPMINGGTRVVAAVGRQLFALDKSTNGEPTKLAFAPSNVIAIGAGARGVIVQLDRGLFRVQGAGLAAITNAPKQVVRVVSDRWLLVEDGAVDLKTGRKTGFPPTVVIAAAEVMEDERLVLVVRDRGAVELVTIAGDKLERDPVDPALFVPGAPIEVAGVAIDKIGRAVIALRDGRVLVREAANGAVAGAWTATQVTDDLPAAKRGAPPALSR